MRRERDCYIWTISFLFFVLSLHFFHDIVLQNMTIDKHSCVSVTLSKIEKSKIILVKTTKNRWQN